MSQEQVWEVIQPYQAPLTAGEGDDDGKMDDEEIKKAVESWTNATLVFSALDGIAHLLFLFLKDNKPVKATASAFHKALQETNQEFIDGIAKIKEGEYPPIVIDPQPIPDWGDDETADELLEKLKAGWEILRPALQLMLKKMQAAKLDPMWTTMINGLVNSGDEMIQAVIDALK
ncbi:MAG: hypothetical protein HQL69_22325 [Magnetococcales bacterium]|nr:hypothetical protein [Magnetococcales bacterium]